MTDVTALIGKLSVAADGRRNGEELARHAGALARLSSDRAAGRNIPEAQWKRAVQRARWALDEAGVRS